MQGYNLDTAGSPPPGGALLLPGAVMLDHSEQVAALSRSIFSRIA